MSKTIKSTHNLLHAVKRMFLVRAFILALLGLCTSVAWAQQDLRFLALGDSYTVGESVPESGSWPRQLAQEMGNRHGITFQRIDVLAKTGWTSGELLAALSRRRIEPDYDWVSLQIGVNDQYRDRSLAEYRRNFERLLQEAISLAGDRPSRVVVLSIPDYAFTPFGSGSTAISQEVDRFNNTNSALSRAVGVLRIDITDISRRGLRQPQLVAADGLHPSAAQYHLWVRKIAPILAEQIQAGSQEHP